MNIITVMIFLLTQDHASCFNNPDVEAAVHEALVEAGVEVYSGYILAEWDQVIGDDDERGEVTSVSFTSDDTPLMLDCLVSNHLLFSVVLSN